MEKHPEYHFEFISMKDAEQRTQGFHKRSSSAFGKDPLKWIVYKDLCETPFASFFTNG